MIHANLIVDNLQLPLWAQASAHMRYLQRFTASIITDSENSDSWNCFWDNVFTTSNTMSSALDMYLWTRLSAIGFGRPYAQ